MQARLTFSTAISIDPDIFIVDEALAAGDGFFIPKCLKRIREICASGATVFFVSHSTYLVKQLCTRAIYIDNGNLIHDGNAQAVCSLYESHMMDIAANAGSIHAEKHGVKIESGLAKIVSIRTLNNAGEETSSFFQHDQLKIVIDLISAQNINNPAVWIKWTRSDGILVTSWLSHEPELQDIGILQAGKNTLSLDIEDLMLGDGSFHVTVGLFEKKDGVETLTYNNPICLWDNVVNLEVRRKTRPLVTFFDQPVRITSVRHEGTT
ncbi:MAG: Wzt carbohydrate-binding domain-containing protein [Pseudobdellovibrio sp.]